MSNYGIGVMEILRPYQERVNQELHYQRFVYHEWMKNLVRGVARASLLATGHETKHMLRYRGIR